MTPSDQLTQFRIPDYLLQDNRRSQSREVEPVGTGVVWFGLALLAVPAVSQNLSPLSIGAWVTGIVLILGGLTRTRIDQSAMLRAGAVTATAGVITLAVLAQGIMNNSITLPPNTDQPTYEANISSDVEEPASDDSAGGSSLAYSGKVPMLRGSPSHTGVLPGPPLAGNPYRLWQYKAGLNLQSTPAIANGSAYFGTRDGYLIALDLLSGMPRWRFDLGGYPVSSAPAVVDRTVFVGSGYAVYAIDEARGTQKWQFPMSYAGESSPTVAEGVVYIASKEHYVYALDAETGERLWSSRTDGLIFGSPTLTDELLLIGGDDGDIFGINRESGIVRWKITAASGVYSTIAVSGDYAIVTLKDRSMLVLRASTGETEWEYPIGGEASPAVSDGLVLVGSDDGTLYAFNIDAGRAPAWIFPTGNGNVLSPVVVDDTVYIAAGPSIFALDRESGLAHWQYPIGDRATTEPVVVDGVLYVGSVDGNLHAITGDDQLNDLESPSN